ncbi:hypothetical protein BST61_g616 [Cercospora zeina]
MADKTSAPHMVALEGSVASAASDHDITDVRQSAATRVFRIDELVEAILRKLCPKDLFVLQRVDQRWRETIRTSPQLQKAMFYRSDEHWNAIAIEWADEEFDEIGRPTQGLKASARLFLSEMSPGQEWRIEARINDIVFEPGGRFPFHRPPNVHWEVHERFNNLMDLSKPRLDQLVRARERDPRRLMHITQPPVAEVSFTVRGLQHSWQSWQSWLSSTVSREDSGGVLVRDIIEEFERICLEKDVRQIGDDEYIRVSYKLPKSLCGRPMIFLNDMEICELARRTRGAPLQ